MRSCWQRVRILALELAERRPPLLRRHNMRTPSLHCNAARNNRYLSTRRLFVRFAFQSRCVRCSPPVHPTPLFAFAATTTAHVTPPDSGAREKRNPDAHCPTPQAAPSGPDNVLRASLCHLHGCLGTTLERNAEATAQAAKSKPSQALSRLKRPRRKYHTQVRSKPLATQRERRSRRREIGGTRKWIGLGFAQGRQAGGLTMSPTRV